MEWVTVNSLGRVRTEVRGGREYVVAPMTMIVSGVLNGSFGPLFYPPEEVEREPTAWNGMPIVLYHPTVNGRHVSARDPVIEERYRIGTVYRSWAGEGKLGAEAWLDVIDCNRKVPGLIKNLRQGIPVGLSTGLYTTNEVAPKGSAWKGKTYTHIARNYKPDHLAILPDVPGACSLSDGCGVLVNGDNRMDFNALLRGISVLGAASQPNPTPPEPTPAVNEPSHSQISSELHRQIRERFGKKSNNPDEVYNGPYIVETYDDYVVYSLDGKYYKIGYKANNRTNEVTLNDDDPVEVRRVTDYKPVSNSAGDSSASYPGGASMTQQKLNDADRKQIVQNLTANCGCPGNMPWKGKDAATLNALPDDVLMAYEETRKVLAANQGTPTNNRDDFVDANGTRHVYNQATNSWTMIPRQTPQPTQPTGNAATGGETTQPTIPVAQPVNPPQQPQPTTNGGVNPPVDRLTAWKATLPPEALAIWNQAETVVNQQKAQLIERLVQNFQGESRTLAVNNFSRFDIPTLQGLVAGLPQQNQLPPSLPPSDFGAVLNFGAAGGSQLQPTTNEEQPLTVPVYNFGNVEPVK